MPEAKRVRETEQTIQQIATSRAKGTNQAEAVAKIVKIDTDARASKPGGRRGRVNRAATLAQCEQALRAFVYGGSSAHGAADSFGLDV